MCCCSRFLKPIQGSLQAPPSPNHVFLQKNQPGSPQSFGIFVGWDGRKCHTAWKKVKPNVMSNATRIPKNHLCDSPPNLWAKICHPLALFGLHQVRNSPDQTQLASQRRTAQTNAGAGGASARMNRYRPLGSTTQNAWRGVRRPRWFGRFGRLGEGKREPSMEAREKWLVELHEAS